ncbi:hypothetical protein [Streptomyces sp. NPDC019937]|uniref:hypothetical protein n=1 Tax=Streptomyces sp. NPDC019937 TaxID=3154787 RepID=UPI0033F5AB50
MSKRDHAKWLGIYDSSPVADVDTKANYRKQSSYDIGDTWEPPRQSTGQHLRLDMTEALYAGCAVEVRDGVVTIQSPYPMGGLIRYTPAN